MVFKYKRKTERGNAWNEQSMEMALQTIHNGESIRKAWLMYNIPFSTLRKHVKSGKNNKSLGRFKTVFTREEEQEFVAHIKDLNSRFYGLTRRDFCELAYQYAEKNKTAHPFRNGAAGPQWYYNFMNRHRELSLRTPEPTSIARARGFNRKQVEIFFDNLRISIEKYKISPDNMYNVDETGIQTSTKRPPKVISMTGKKQVGCVSSSERGTLITALFCCSATGRFIPPSLVFPRKKRNPRYMEGTPPGSLDLVTDSGWITSDAFLSWLKFFVSHVRPSENHKCLLILDNHASHRSIQVLDYASQNNVVILSVPPHTTHKLQPLDVSVYGPFGTYFQTEIDKWQKSHPAQHVTFFEIGKIFNNAYLKAATPMNAIKGFEKTGILQCDMDVFSEVDFLPADVTNIEESIDHTQDVEPTEIKQDTPATGSLFPQEGQVDQEINNIQTDIIRRNNETTPDKQCSSIDITQPSLSSCNATNSKEEYVKNYNETTPEKECVETSQPGPSDINAWTQSNTNQTNMTLKENKKIKIIDIQIIPKCDKRKQTKTDKQCTDVSQPGPSDLKISTFKDEALKESNKINITDIHEIPKCYKRNQTKPRRNTQKSEILTSTPIKEDIRSKCKTKDKDSVKRNIKDTQIIKAKMPRPPSPPKIFPDEGETPCLLCGETFNNSAPGEKWVQCNICESWVHVLCSDYKTGIYICDCCRTKILAKRR